MESIQQSLFAGKTCTKCNEWKSISEFYLNHKTGKYYPRCISCKNADRRDQYIKHKDRELATIKRWQEANPERYKEIKKIAYARITPEQMKVYDLRRAESKRAYQKTERFKFNNRLHIFRRRAKCKVNTTKSITLREWKELCAKFGNRCLCCGASDKKLTMDHVVPICKNGGNELENIQPLCAECNRRKWKDTTDYRVDFYDRYGA